MKSILLSIKPEWVAKILNKDKTIEVRKKFPKDYVGWVYLYCSKDKKNKLEYCDINNGCWCANDGGDYYNGKVVARFWCDKVDKWDIWQKDLEEKVKLACLSIKEFDDYSKGQVAYAIHIPKLEIFDRPRELGEFHTVNKYGIPQYQFGKGTWVKPITKAPQNYCYIEGE